MVNKSGNLGTAFESALVKYLKREGHLGALRIRLSGVMDRSDVWDASPPKVAFECKAGQAAERASLNQIEAWQGEAIKEAAHAGADTWVLVVKRKGTGLANMGAQRAFLELDGWRVEVPLEKALRILKSHNTL